MFVSNFQNQREEIVAAEILVKMETTPHTRQRECREMRKRLRHEKHEDCKEKDAKGRN